MQAIVDAAKKEVYFHGLALVDDIHQLVAAKLPHVRRELVAQALPLVEGFPWLEERSGWCPLEGIGKHGLPKTIDKVLAVAGEVTAEDLRAAMARNRRLWKDPAAGNVLLEFCRHMPGVRIDGHRIISDPPRDWRKSLTGVERQAGGRAQEARPGHGARRDGRPLRGRRHEPLQLPCLRLLVPRDRAVGAQRLRSFGHARSATGKLRR